MDAGGNLLIGVDLGEDGESEDRDLLHQLLHVEVASLRRAEAVRLLPSWFDERSKSTACWLCSSAVRRSLARKARAALPLVSLGGLRARESLTIIVGERGRLRSDADAEIDCESERSPAPVFNELDPGPVDAVEVLRGTGILLKPGLASYQ